MARHVDKLVISHRAALTAKYGSSGVSAVRRALRELADDDKARGISSRLFLLDDGTAARGLGASAVTDPTDQPAVKAAIDAAAAAVTPHYVMLVGASDVVPQQSLTNSTPDEDPDVPSDLPYASALPFSNDPGDFVGPTRVVGRLPDLVGATDPSYLLKLLRIAVEWRARPARDYLPAFALTAKVWQGSTTLSVAQLAGTGTEIHVSPDEGPNWEKNLFRRRMHFVNCHGDEADPQWYGDDGTSQPVSVAALVMRRAVSRGTVVAAECCYGAQHYDPALVGQMGIAATYLREGAYGVFGSSTISYGDSDTTTSADLITRFFLSAVLEGASLGRAALQARQRFVQELGELDPYDLKTLAQFDLLGDPSIHPVRAPGGGLAPHALGGSGGAGGTPSPRSKRAQPAGRDGVTVPARAAFRRNTLRIVGEAIAASVPRAVPVPMRPRSAHGLSAAATVGVPAPANATVRRYAARVPETVAPPVTFTVVDTSRAPRRHVAVVVREERGTQTTSRTVHSR